jgi:hypothetical protein
MVRSARLATPCWPRKRSHARRAERTGGGSGSPHPRPGEQRIGIGSLRALGLPRLSAASP